MPNKVTDKDKGLKKFLKILDEVIEVEIDIKGNDDIKKRALLHEFGDGGSLPARSFIRGYIDEKRSTVEKRIKKMAEVALKTKKSLTIPAQKFGGITVIEIKRRIGEHIPPPLKDDTVKRKIAKNSKAPSTPLIDTGGMRNAISFKVNKLNK